MTPTTRSREDRPDVRRSSGTAPADVPRAWPRGHRIAAFEFIEPVSVGERSVVYRAWDHGLGRAIAIKEYFPQALARREPDGQVRPIRAEAAELLDRERADTLDRWRAFAACDHPAIVRVLHLLEAQGTAGLVMPWYEGRTLASLPLENGLPLPPRELRGLLDDLLGALETLHRAGWAHGNLAPAKVLLRDGAPALLLGSGSNTASTRGASADAVAADLQALAAIGRYCITGILPSAAGAGVPESLASTVEQLAFDRLAAGYDAGLRAVLGEGPVPRTVDAFRRRLADDTAPIATPAPESAAPPEVVAFRAPPVRADADARTAAAAPATAPVPATAPAAEEVELIRRVLASIPDRAEPPRRRPPGGPVLSEYDPIRIDPGENPRHAPPALPRSRPAVRLVVTLLGATALAIGAWHLYEQGQTRAAAPSPAVDPAPVVRADPPIALSAPPAAAPSAQTPPPSAPAPVSAAAPAVPAPVAAAPPVTATPSPPVDVPSARSGSGSVSPAPAIEPPRDPPANPPAKRAASPTGPPVARAAAPSSPRAVCGGRTAFSLYRCMQTQCSLATWRSHPECRRLRATDSVD